MPNMPTEFYVKDATNNLVPAYHVTLNGVRIADANTEWATGIELWDASGNFIGKNTSGYLVAPTNYTIETSLNYGASIKALELNPNTVGAGLTQMFHEFPTGGAQDLQRSYIGYMGEQVVNGPAV